MRRIRASVIAGIICIVVAVHSVFAVVVTVNQMSPVARPFQVVSESMFSLVALMFCIPAALIISKQPRNGIGWLLMVPALIFTMTEWMENYLNQFIEVAPPPTLLVYLMLMVTSVAWLALIFPLLLIPLLFPTGKPPTPRWRWLIYLAVGMILFFIVWAAGTPRFTYTENPKWSLPNPFGFLPPGTEEYVMTPWSIALAVLAIGSLSSVVARYRMGSTVEREQLKWLLYACAVFTVVYVMSIYEVSAEALTFDALSDLVDIAFGLGILAIPAAIAVAILRYHLFDIDVIIRQTLVYALLTGLLGLVYTGGIVVLQGGFRAVSGQGSDLAVVITTLLIAAMFNPLRARIQTAIDRRFFRQKYNAERALAEFSEAARSLSDLDELNGMLLDITQRTLQPTQVDLVLLKK